MSFIQAGGPKVGLQWIQDLWDARDDAEKAIKMYRLKTGNFVERGRDSEIEMDEAVEKQEVQRLLVKKVKRTEWDLTDRSAQYLLS